MKQIILTLTALLIGLILNSQSDKTLKNGKITFEKKVKLDIQLEGDASEFADMLPKERKSKKVLYFNEEASLYERIKEDDIEDVAQNHEEGIVIKIEEPDDKIYTDLKKKQYTEQKEFMTRMFLIEGEINSNGWKITGKQKKILGYNCQEAEKMKDSIKIVAWFTPEIPISAGPEHIAGLPGFVLEVDYDEGKQTIVAVDIDKKEQEKIKINKPSKGKKVTKEEFEKIVAEKMKEMGAEDGAKGSNKVFIKIKTD